MNLKEIFRRDGRISNRQFVPYFMCFIASIFCALAVCKYLCQGFPDIFAKQTASGEIDVTFAIHIVFYAITIPFYMALFLGGMRRCRDLDMNPLFSALLAIPYLNVLFGLYLCIKKGTPGRNRYGNAPLPRITGASNQGGRRRMK